MSKSIRRGNPPARRPVQPKRRVAKVQKPSQIDRMIAMLPVSERTLQRIATWSIMGVIGAGALGVASLFGMPQAAGVAVAEEIGRAGFRVRGIEVTGVKRMNPMTVYAVALDQQSRAMPLVDLEGVRQRLLKYGWIADAQVSRRLPDKLVVHIIERQPAAVWQEKGQLTLIDANGEPLQQISPDELPELPRVIGEGANWQTPAYRALLDAAPALRPLVKAATWVGNRRWNIVFETGETLVLPEENPEKALVKFAELDGAQALLGKGWLRFDMRDPTRLVVRKPGHQGQRAITDTSTNDKSSDGPNTGAVMRIDRQG
ncbi:MULTISPECIES: cell division protein FtsQ/DivIB [unclassified Sphingomonas]|uniref:cell division protein FtsQ/DivIB n=1 Tax=unclassified Sphingomonas TaxID=196159 RepID=UPI000BCAA429|nr:MAG: cell division protein FtsQ [Sphingomonas sp. 12-62-6]OYX39739.1 MAG: cell division protein FtsQ [Sphingomonas sp. 32-62-10]